MNANFKRSEGISLATATDALSSEPLATSAMKSTWGGKAQKKSYRPHRNCDSGSKNKIEVIGEAIEEGSPKKRKLENCERSK